MKDSISIVVNIPRSTLQKYNYTNINELTYAQLQDFTKDVVYTILKQNLGDDFTCEGIESLVVGDYK